MRHETEGAKMGRRGAFYLCLMVRLMQIFEYKIMRFLVLCVINMAIFNPLHN